MDYRKLLEKYNNLLEQVDRLTKENRRLKAKLGLQEPPALRNTTQTTQMECAPEGETNDGKPLADLCSASDSISKIRLFMSLFKGRKDANARRWENRKKGTSGYAPVCLNQWQPGVCSKPKIPCSKCKNKSYAVLDENAIEDHLRGNIVVGIYPMLPDETCCFLAMDFDEADWL